MNGRIIRTNVRFLVIACFCKFVFFVVFPFATNSHSALAQQQQDSELNCGILLNAMKNRQITEDFYKEMCGSTLDVKSNNLFSTANIEQIVQSVATRSPSMIQQIKEFGPPERVIALLGQQSLDQQRSILSSLNWRFYHNLIDYITSKDINYYIEEFLFSNRADTRNPSNSRFTTLFWIALRSQDPFFLKNVLDARLSPYRLESDPSKAANFPCAANIYLCVVNTEQTAAEEKQQILTTLESFKIHAPSWTREALWQNFSRYNFGYVSVPNKEICEKAASNDCRFVTSILSQATIIGQDNNATYQFTDYAGYDAIEKKHLFTGRAGGDVFAAWIPAVSGANGLVANREIQVISHRVIDGQISQYKDQVGKRIQYFNRLYQTGLLAFDTIQSKYVIRVTQRAFY